MWGGADSRASLLVLSRNWQFRIKCDLSVAIATPFKLYLEIASFPGSAQLFVACSTNSDRKLGGPGNEANLESPETSTTAG